MEFGYQRHRERGGDISATVSRAPDSFPSPSPSSPSPSTSTTSTVHGARRHPTKRRWDCLLLTYTGMILRAGFLCRSCLSRAHHLRQTSAHAHAPPQPRLLQRQRTLPPPPPWIQWPQLLRRNLSRHARFYSTDYSKIDGKLRRLQSLTEFIEEPKQMKKELHMEYDKLGRTTGQENQGTPFHPELPFPEQVLESNEIPEEDIISWFDPEPDRDNLKRGRMRVPKFMWSPKGYPEKNKILGYTLRDVTSKAEKYRIQSHFAVWRFEFATTWQRIRPRELFEKPLPPLIQERTLDARVKQILENHDLPRILLAWIETMDTTKGHTVEKDWRMVMIAILRFYPERAIEFCQATFDENMTPHYAVRDIVGFLVAWAFKPRYPDGPVEQKVREEVRAALPDFLLHILRHSSPRFAQFHQWSLYNILRSVDAEKLDELATELEKYQHPVHPYTQFQIAGRLAKDVRYKNRALDCLEKLITTEGVPADTPHCMALSCAIIHFAKPDNGNTMIGQLRTELTERLLSIVTPTLYTYSVMIRSQCINNNFETGLRIYDVMVEHEVKPDTVLCAILLDGAKRTGNLDNIRTVLRLIPPHHWRDKRLARELVHTVYTYSREKYPRLDIFGCVFAVYSRLFSLKSLQRLIPYDVAERAAAPSSEEQQAWQADLRQIVELLPEVDKIKQDDVGTLAIMLRANVLNIGKTYYTVMRCHSHLRALLSRGDPLTCRLIREKGTFIHDATIMSLLGDSTGWQIARDVVLADMLEGARAQQAAVEAAQAEGQGEDPSEPLNSWPTEEAEQKQRKVWKETGKPHQSMHPPPSVYTWTNLIFGAMKYKRYSQAESLLRMMSQHGTKPSTATYNAMLSSYGEAQQGTRMVELVGEMEREKVEFDDRTLRYFQKLRHKEKAFAQLEQMLNEKAEQQVISNEEDRLLDLPDVDKLTATLIPPAGAAKVEDAEGDWAALEALLTEPPKMPTEKMKASF
ncbi:hypothetical protein QBC35DRAFT_489237, partial [Podospora australis]